MLLTRAVAVCRGAVTWTDSTVTSKLSICESWLLRACLQPPGVAFSRATTMLARSFEQIFCCSAERASLCRLAIACATSCSSPLNLFTDVVLPQAATARASEGTASRRASGLVGLGIRGARVRDGGCCRRYPPGSDLLVGAAVAESRGDAVGGREEIGAERVDHLLERDHRAVGRQAHGGDDLACLVAHGRRDRVEIGRELFVVDGEALVAHLIELIAQRFLARDRVGAAFAELHRAEQLALLGLGQVREQDRAHRGGVGGKPR